MDESDKPDPLIRKISSNAWMVQGKIDIEEVNKRLKIGFKRR